MRPRVQLIATAKGMLLGGESEVTGHIPLKTLFFISLFHYSTSGIMVFLSNVQ